MSDQDKVYRQRLADVAAAFSDSAMVAERAAVRVFLRLQAERLGGAGADGLRAAADAIERGEHESEDFITQNSQRLEEQEERLEADRKLRGRR